MRKFVFIKKNRQHYRLQRRVPFNAAETFSSSYRLRYSTYCIDPLFSFSHEATKLKKTTENQTHVWLFYRETRKTNVPRNEDEH